MRLGFMGLGNMGRNLALNLQESGHEVIAWNRSPENRELARVEGLNVVGSVEEMIVALNDDAKRKVVWLMVAAGPAVDEVLFGEGGLAGLLSKNDIVIDGANSHFRDSMRRAELLAEKGINYLDCGVSGGIAAARSGPSLMVGGEKEAFDHTEQLFSDLAAASGYAYFGRSGAGHYVKMVHNGIEYGMMQSIAEGLNLLGSSEFADELDLKQVVNVWNHGAVIQGNLMGFLAAALEKDPKLNEIEPEVGSLGTGRWTAEEALRLGVPLDSITHAVFNRYQSQGTAGLLYKVIQAMRAEFGGHTSGDRPAA